MNANEAREWWIHRVTWSDGKSESSRLRHGRPGAPCSAGISQRAARKLDPGAVVEHIVLAHVEVAW